MVNGNLLHYVVIHKITKKQVIIADPGVGIVKLKPEEFFGEIYEDGKSPKYQWTGVLILLVKNETFKTGQSFYRVKSIIEKNKVNKKININNGMITQVKIVVDEKTVIKYTLEKINLWD